MGLLLLLIIVPIILCGGPPGCNLHKRHAERPCNEYAYQTGQSRTAFAGWKCVNVNGKGVCRGPMQYILKKKKLMEMQSLLDASYIRDTQILHVTCGLMNTENHILLLLGGNV